MPRLYELEYGAIELKRCYQKNMCAGIGFSLLISTIIAMAVWVASLASDPPVVIVNNRPIDTVPFTPLGHIVVIPSQPGINVAPLDLTKKLTGKIEVVDDGFEGGATTAKIPNQKEIEGIINGIYISGAGEDGGVGGFNGVVGKYDGIPSPDTFIICEEQPVLIHEEPPVYPKLAEEAGFSATVTVQAFVSKDGKVLKAMVVKNDRPGIGFEEAAICSALKSIYRPALQNGHPVGIWIVYKVRFVIGD